MMARSEHGSKRKLIDAAVRLVLTKGYAATTLDEVGRHAGVTKGSLFHHFKNKDELALAAVQHFVDDAERLFATAPYQDARNPRDRLLAYIDYRLQMLSGDVAEFTCLLGTLVQEIHDTHPDIRAACERGLASHVDGLIMDLREAKARYAPTASWSAESVGLFMQAVLQGSFIQSKASLTPDIARENLLHLRRYLELLFTQPRSTSTRRRHQGVPHASAPTTKNRPRT